MIKRKKVYQFNLFNRLIKKRIMTFGLFVVIQSFVLIISGCSLRQTEVAQKTVEPPTKTKQAVKIERHVDHDLQKEEIPFHLFEFASRFREPRKQKDETTIKDESNRLRIAYLEATTMTHELENHLSDPSLSMREQETMPEVSVPTVREPINLWQVPKLFVSQPVHILPSGTMIDAYSYFSLVPGSDLTPTIAFTPIDPNQIGYQSMTITAIDSKGMTSTAIVTFLFNRSPILQQLRQERHVMIGSTIDLLSDVTAYDEEDGDLTSAIEVKTNLQPEKEGAYEVIYSVKDQFGVSTSLTASLTITNEAPLIIGPERLVFPVNQPFSLLDHFSASDLEDGNIKLTSENILSSTLDTNLPGSYSITLGNVVDRYGKAAAERIIHVHLTNEAPTIANTHDTLPVFSELNKEAYLAKLVLADREDPAERLSVTIDVSFWQRIDPTRLGVYRFPLQVQDTHGKTTRTFGSIEVVNEPPAFVGIEDKEIVVGEEALDLLAGITVFDREEIVSLKDVEVTADITWDTPGVYPVYLTIKDTFTKTTESFNVIIRENAAEASKE